MLLWSGFWAIAGGLCVAFTAAWHASGAYAVFGAVWLLLALGYLGAGLQRRRSEQSDAASCDPTTDPRRISAS